jgi:hypothetical protein
MRYSLITHRHFFFYKLNNSIQFFNIHPLLILTTFVQLKQLQIQIFIIHLLFISTALMTKTDPGAERGCTSTARPRAARRRPRLSPSSSSSCLLG